MNSVRAASVQFNHKHGDKPHNLARITEFAEAAVTNEVDLLVFPEMCITGYWGVRKMSQPEIEALSEPIPGGPSSQALLALAAKYGMTIGAGLIEQDAAGDLYNAYVAAMPDGRVAVHRKLHTFISEYMKSGDSFTVADTPHGVRIGILICYDVNIIENVRITALQGAEILLAPHQTGGCATPSPRCMGAIDPALWENRHTDPEAIEAEFRGPKGREWLMRWLPSRAHDNGMFLIFSNGVGRDDNEVRTGNAMILDPYGDILTETWKAEDKMVIADLDPQVLDKCTGTRWMATRRPDLYDSLVKFTGREQDTRAVRFDFGEDNT